MAKPAPAPISVPGHSMLLPRSQQGFDLRQALQRADINPASRHVFPRYLADVPRFFAYIEAVLAERPELSELAELLGSLRQPSEVTL